MEMRIFLFGKYCATHILSLFRIIIFYNFFSFLYIDLHKIDKGKIKSTLLINYKSCDAQYKEFNTKKENHFHFLKFIVGIDGYDALIKYYI